MSGELSAPNALGFDPSLAVPGSIYFNGERWRRVQLRQLDAENEPVLSDIQVALDGDVEVFEGDIDLSPAPEEGLLYGITVRHGHGIWPGGVIHALVEPSIENLVSGAIRQWMEKTPLRFVRGTHPDGFLVFEDRGVCRSKIGRVGGPQLVEINRDATLGAVVHEIGHAIGLWHEHSRRDRNQHVRIVPGHVQPNQLYNFDFHDGTAIEHGPYDIDSMMHYESDAFSATGQPTIVTRAGAALRPRQGLTSGDVAAVRSLYPQLAWT